MPTGLQFFYGGYVHPVGEVYPRSIEVRPLFNDYNIRWGSTIRYEIAGDFCADPATPLDAAGVDAKIGALDAAYLHDYQDFGFLLDGALTNHEIQNDDPFNLSGNQVLGRSWLYRGPNEFTNTRSFNVTLGCTFRESYNNIVMYKEQVYQRGTGGERWTYRPRWLGAPKRQSIHDQTPVELVQSGIIVGLDFRPLAPDPYWPDDEVEPDRIIHRFTPRFHGHLDFDRPTHFGLKYSYRFLMATDPARDPDDWIVP